MSDDIEPGWYPDPKDEARERFWSGRRWTSQVRIPKSAEAEEAEADEPPVAPPDDSVDEAPDAGGDRAGDAEDRATGRRARRGDASSSTFRRRRLLVVGVVVLLAVAAGVLVVVLRDGGTTRTGPVELASSGLATCGRFERGEVRCWGAADGGALGSDDAASGVAGRRVLQGATALTGGGGRFCALVAGGRARCWGGGTAEPRDAPIRDLTQVAVTSDHACGIRRSGAVACWGEGELGQLGAAPAADDGTHPVDQVTGAVSVAVGPGFSCAVDGKGAVWCWGDDRSGQLGSERPELTKIPPIEVEGVGPARQVVADADHACAVLRDRTAWCWGRNDRGQLGTGEAADVSPPARVAELSGVRSLAVGSWSGCALLEAGRLRCWGDDTTGQVGVGSDGPSALTPVDVRAGGRVAAVAVGTFHACAARTDGVVRCWGAAGAGQLGRGIGIGSRRPVDVEVGGA